MTAMEDLPWSHFGIKDLELLKQSGGMAGQLAAQELRLIHIIVAQNLDLEVIHSWMPTNGHLTPAQHRYWREGGSL